MVISGEELPLDLDIKSKAMKNVIIRIFKYSQGLKIDESKKFLASCLSHSIHRFTKGFKKHVKFENTEELLCVNK